MTHAISGLVLTEHEFSLPLDHARPGNGLCADGDRILGRLIDLARGRA